MPYTDAQAEKSPLLPIAEIRRFFFGRKLPGRLPDLNKINKISENRDFQVYLS